MPTATARHVPGWPLGAVLLWTAACLGLAAHGRLCPAERAFAWPWSGAWSGPLPGTWLLAAAGAAAVALAAAWRLRPEPAARRALLALAVWPAAPMVLGWLVLPAAGPPTRGATVAMALVIAAGAWFARRRPGSPRSAARRGAFAGRIWRTCHAVALVGVLVIGWATGSFASPQVLLTSLVLYPVYALVQLACLLAVPWPHLRALAGARRGPAILAAAVLFGLVHWPNPLLMALSAAGMAVWAREYDRGRGLVPLAISMGLLATLVTQGLPDRWTEHMRAGPGCVRQRAVPALAAGADRRTADLPAGEPRLRAFLLDLYPGIVGRAPRDGELDAWWRTLVPCQRGVLAWRFYVSDEYRRKFGEPAGEAPLPGDVHWTRLPDPWPARIGAFTRPDPAVPPDDWDGFLARLYREILHREATATERAAWSPALSPRQRQRLVEVLLERRRELARSPLDTLACRDLRLHH